MIGELEKCKRYAIDDTYSKEDMIKMGLLDRGVPVIHYVAIGEARKEFPERIRINADKPVTQERLIQKLQETWSWFLKYFGDEKG